VAQGEGTCACDYYCQYKGDCCADLPADCPNMVPSTDKETLTNCGNSVGVADSPKPGPTTSLRCASYRPGASTAACMPVPTLPAGSMACSALQGRHCCALDAARCCCRHVLVRHKLCLCTGLLQGLPRVPAQLPGWALGLLPCQHHAGTQQAPRGGRGASSRAAVRRRRPRRLRFGAACCGPCGSQGRWRRVHCGKQHAD
jgi:hypothetical protein